MNTYEEVAKLCGAEAGRLAGYLATSGCSWPLIDDILQEAFVVALVKGTEILAHPNPTALLYRIAQGLARDRRRADEARESNELRWHDREGRLPADPTEVVARDVDLYLALGQLTEKQRDVVFLYRCADLRLADVADILGITEGAVKSHLRRGEKRLRRLLDNPCEGGSRASG